jgi:CBS domain-containing protein
MNISRYTLAAAAALALLSGPACAAAVEPPAPILEWSFYVLLIFAACVIGFVVLKTSKKRKHEPLSSMLLEMRRPVSCVNPETTIIDSIGLMNEQNIGAVLVMDDDKLPIYVDPSTTVEEAIGIVNDRRIRHLPIFHNGKLVGIVSSGDLTHWMVRDRESEIRELVDTAAHTRPR